MIRLVKLALAMTALCLLTAGSALAAPARTIDLDAGEQAGWQGARATGLNVNYFGILGPAGQIFPSGTCDTSPQSYCDTTLVAFTNPVPETDADGRLRRIISVDIGDFAPVPAPATDFDLLAFASDGTGARGAELARDTQLESPESESIRFALTTTRENPTAYVLIEVVYFAAIESSYRGTIQG